MSGAQIVNRPDEIQESDVGKECGLFEIKKIGNNKLGYFNEKVMSISLISLSVKALKHAQLF